MASIPRRVLIYAALSAACILGADAISIRQKSGRFRADDPIWREPEPYSLAVVEPRGIDALYDLYNSFAQRGKWTRETSNHASRGTNTVDEVPDSAWYTNRRRGPRFDREQLVCGPGNENAPAAQGTWRILSAKSDGVTPGFLIEDESKRRYLVKFDPPGNPELASAADVIGSRIFYALGYSTPENYIVRFRRAQLSIATDAMYRDLSGRKRRFTARHLEELLREQPRDGQGRYRAMASRLIHGPLLGPFRYEGTRADDPNDLIPHEDRRDLRGLAVFAAWLNHTDAKSINTLDTLVERDGRRFVQHYLIDFGASLGSDSFGPKDARLGHEYMIDPKATVRQILTLGAWVPQWARAPYPRTPSVGRFTAEGFQPDRWKSNYPNPAFQRLQPDDAFWAAKQIMAFTDEDIRAVVSTGEYSDPAAADYVARTLIRRRDVIGRTWFTRVLPLDRFAVAADDELTFIDLAAEYGVREPRAFVLSWSVYNNATDRASTVSRAAGRALPEEIRQLRPSQYALATIGYARPERGEHSLRTNVYLRREQAGWTVVGVERMW